MYYVQVKSILDQWWFDITIPTDGYDIAMTQFQYWAKNIRDNAELRIMDTNGGQVYPVQSFKVGDLVTSMNKSGLIERIVAIEGETLICEILESPEGSIYRVGQTDTFLIGHARLLGAPQV